MQPCPLIVRPSSGNLLRAVAACFVVVVTLLLPRLAHAMLMPHYDLDSLALESDAIIAATKVSERKVDEYTTATTLRVTRVYWSAVANDLEIGKTLELEYSLYTFGPPWGYDGAEHVPEVAPEMVFFLSHPKERAGQGVDPRAWFIVSSGMRIFMDGRLHRFVQMNNPGGFNAVPGERPHGTKTPFDRVGFDAELQRAVIRANYARATLAEPASPSRTARLVSLARDPLVAEGGEDLLGAAIIRALGKGGGVDAVLDARAGAARVRAFGLDHGISVERLVDAAARATTLERRLAALSLLLGMGFELGSAQDVGPRLGKLLSDPEKSIRLATLALWFTDQKTPKAFADAVIARFAVEQDPLVRMSLYMRARALGRESELKMDGIELPLVAATAHAGNGGDPSLTVEWLDAEANADSVIVELRDGDRLVHREDLLRRNIGSSSGGERSSMTVPLTFASPVEERQYDVTIDLALRRRDAKVADIQRRIVIGPALVARLEVTSSVPAPAPSAAAPAIGASQSGGPDPRKFALGALVVAAVVAGALAIFRRRRLGRRAVKPH